MFLMHMQLAVLCLFGMSVVGATGNDDEDYSSESCRRYAGVYNVAVAGTSVNTVDIVAFSQDGLFNGVVAATTNQAVPGLSNLVGTYKCESRCSVVVTAFAFNYPTVSIVTNEGKLKFYDNGYFNGTIMINYFTVASATKPQAQWKQSGLPSDVLNVEGYILSYL
jgi:hypothetical protein